MQDNLLRFRITSELKEQFFKKCKELKLNPSQVLKSLVKDFIEEKK